MKLYAIYLPETDTYYDKQSKCLDLLSSTTWLFDNKKDAEKIVGIVNGKQTAPIYWSAIHHQLAWDLLEKRTGIDRYDIEIGWDDLCLALREFQNLEVKELYLTDKKPI